MWLIYAMLYVTSGLFGSLLMRKLDDTSVFNFKYLLASLVFINLTIVVLGLSFMRLNAYVVLVALPFCFSFIAGHIFFLFKGTY